MPFRRMIAGLGSLALTFLLAPPVAQAAALSVTGIFVQDDNVAYIPFVVGSYGQVTIQTWSFGGGVNAAGTAIPSGGFATVLTLIFPDDSIYSDDGSHACGSCNIDPVFGGTSDAYINLFLDAGTYRVALTQLDNVPVGPSWTDGVTRSGQGNFTQDFAYSGGPSAPFLLFYDGSKRNGNWAVDIVGEDVQEQIPEPASLALAALGLVLLAASRRTGLRRPPEI